MRCHNFLVQFFFQRAETVGHEEILLSCRFQRCIFFSLKMFHVGNTEKHFFSQIKLPSFILFYFCFPILTSKVSFSLEPTRNLINSVLEYKINFLKYNVSYGRKQPWEKQLLTVNLKKNLKIYIFICLFILNLGFISWLIVKNTIQGSYHKPNRNDTK